MRLILQVLWYLHVSLASCLLMAYKGYQIIDINRLFMVFNVILLLFVNHLRNFFVIYRLPDDWYYPWNHGRIYDLSLDFFNNCIYIYICRVMRLNMIISISRIYYMVFVSQYKAWFKTLWQSLDVDHMNTNITKYSSFVIIFNRKVYIPNLPYKSSYIGRFRKIDITTHGHWEQLHLLSTSCVANAKT